MDNYRINLFEVENPGQLAFSYRLIAVRGLDRATLSNPDLMDRNLNLLAKLVAIREKCPVAIVRDGDANYLAVPEGIPIEQTEYHLAPDVVALKPLGDTRHTSLLDSGRESRHVALSFLSFSLRGPLRTHLDLWSSGTHAFFSKRPINAREINREIDLYEGFHFHLRYLDNRLFVGVKLVYKYVDVAWAVDRFTVEECKRLKMRMFLYHFGNRWYPIQLLETLSQSIQEARFVLEETGEPVSVFDYTIGKAGDNPPPWIRSLDPNKPAILYRSPGRDQRLFAALGLAKLIHRTEDAGARELHRRSIKRPDERFRFSSQVIEHYFQGRQFFGTAVRILGKPHPVCPRIYAIPALEFGQGKVLHVGKNTQRGETPLIDLGRARTELLLDRDAGVAVASALEPQYILIPLSLDRAIASDVAKRLETVTRSFLSPALGFPWTPNCDENE